MIDLFKNKNKASEAKHIKTKFPSRCFFYFFLFGNSSWKLIAFTQTKTIIRKYHLAINSRYKKK